MGSTPKRLRTCINSFSDFCYCCGEYAGANGPLLSPAFRDAYFKYFNLRVGDQDKPWAPHQACRRCYSLLSDWAAGGRKSLPFCVPVQWREPTNHLDDCFLCLSVIKSVCKSKRIYGFCVSASRPVPRPAGQPVPRVPTSHAEAHSEDDEPAVVLPSDADFEPSDVPSANTAPPPGPINQSSLNSIIKRLHLSKVDSEVLGSALREVGALTNDTRTTFRNRHEQFLPYFQDKFFQNVRFTYCSDIPGLFNEFKFPHDPDKWVLFIDSGKNSLKFALIHREPNPLLRKPSVIIGYSFGQAEKYEFLRFALDTFRYNDFNWKVCCDLKVVGLLNGLKGGFPRHMCHLCLFEGRKRETHYTTIIYPPRTEDNSDEAHSVIKPPLIPSENIIIPPLHIKLGLMKQFVKAMNKVGSEAFDYLNLKFKSRLSAGKIKEGTFIGPQIRELLDDTVFETLLRKGDPKEHAAWIKTWRP